MGFYGLAFIKVKKNGVRIFDEEFCGDAQELSSPDEEDEFL